MSIEPEINRWTGLFLLVAKNKRIAAAADWEIRTINTAALIIQRGTTLVNSNSSASRESASDAVVCAVIQLLR